MFRPIRTATALVCLFAMSLAACKTIYTDVYSPRRNYFKKVEDKPKPPTELLPPPPSVTVPPADVPPPALPDAPPPAPEMTPPPPAPAPEAAAPAIPGL